MQSKKGVCNNIALTLKRTCDLLNIENELIKGYVKISAKDIQKTPEFKNHIWNAVKINNNWILIDATFGIDYDKKNQKQKSNYTFFNIDKERLNLTHYPSNSKWLKIMNQNSLESFSNLPFFSNVFINSNAELISPEKGELITSNNKLSITLKNLKSTKITYKFNNEDFAKEPKIFTNNSFTNVIIPNSKKSEYLTLYFNNITAITYKIR